MAVINQFVQYEFYSGACRRLIPLCQQVIPLDYENLLSCTGTGCWHAPELGAAFQRNRVLSCSGFST